MSKKTRTSTSKAAAPVDEKATAPAPDEAAGEPTSLSRVCTEALNRKFVLLEQLKVRGVTRDPRKCIRWMKIDPSQPLNPDWVLNEDKTRRLCERWSIAGGTVCIKHGGNVKRTREAARRRFAAMVDPTMSRLEEIRDQSDHMPSALGASIHILNRGLGKVGDSPRVGQLGASIHIGIALVPGQTPKVLQLGAPDDALDADVSEPDEDEA